MPLAFSVGREDAGLDEMADQLDREQRVAVGLVEQIRGEAHPVVPEGMTGGRLEQGDGGRLQAALRRRGRSPMATLVARASTDAKSGRSASVDR